MQRLRLVFIGTVFVLICSAASWVLWLPVAAPDAGGWVELRTVADTLPPATMKSYSVCVPRDGRLVLSVKTTPSVGFNAYLVRVDDVFDNTSRSGSLSILSDFSFRCTGAYTRQAQIAGGTYHLTLARMAGASDSPAPTVRIYARLAP